MGYLNMSMAGTNYHAPQISEYQTSSNIDIIDHGRFMELEVGIFPGESSSTRMKQEILDQSNEPDRQGQRKSADVSRSLISL